MCHSDEDLYHQLMDERDEALFDLGACRDELTDAQQDVARLEDALVRIRRDEGKVCGVYEICTHGSCQSSYSAWAIADAALEGHSGV